MREWLYQQVGVLRAVCCVHWAVNKVLLAVCWLGHRRFGTPPPHTHNKHTKHIHNVYTHTHQASARMVECDADARRFWMTRAQLDVLANEEGPDAR